MFYSFSSINIYFNMNFFLYLILLLNILGIIYYANNILILNNKEDNEINSSSEGEEDATEEAQSDVVTSKEVAESAKLIVEKLKKEYLLKNLNHISRININGTNKYLYVNSKIIGLGLDKKLVEELSRVHFKNKNVNNNWYYLINILLDKLRVLKFTTNNIYNKLGKSYNNSSLKYDFENLLTRELYNKYKKISKLEMSIVDDLYLSLRYYNNDRFSKSSLKKDRLLPDYLLKNKRWLDFIDDLVPNFFRFEIQRNKVLGQYTYYVTSHEKKFSSNVLLPKSLSFHLRNNKDYDLSNTVMKYYRQLTSPFSIYINSKLVGNSTFFLKDKLSNLYRNELFSKLNKNNIFDSYIESSEDTSDLSNDEVEYNIHKTHDNFLSNNSLLYIHKSFKHFLKFKKGSNVDDIESLYELFTHPLFITDSLSVFNEHLRMGVNLFLTNHYSISNFKGLDTNAELEFEKLTQHFINSFRLRNNTVAKEFEFFSYPNQENLDEYTEELEGTIFSSKESALDIKMKLLLSSFFDKIGIFTYERVNNFIEIFDDIFEYLLYGEDSFEEEEEEEEPNSQYYYRFLNNYYFSDDTNLTEEFLVNTIASVIGWDDWLDTVVEFEDRFYKNMEKSYRSMRRSNYIIYRLGMYRKKNLFNFYYLSKNLVNLLNNGIINCHYSFYNTKYRLLIFIRNKFSLSNFQFISFYNNKKELEESNFIINNIVSLLSLILGTIFSLLVYNYSSGIINNIYSMISNMVSSFVFEILYAFHIPNIVTYIINMFSEYNLLTKFIIIKNTIIIIIFYVIRAIFNYFYLYNFLVVFLNNLIMVWLAIFNSLVDILLHKTLLLINKTLLFINNRVLLIKPYLILKYHMFMYYCYRMYYTVYFSSFIPLVKKKTSFINWLIPFRTFYLLYLFIRMNIRFYIYTIKYILYKPLNLIVCAIDVLVIYSRIVLSFLIRCLVGASIYILHTLKLVFIMLLSIGRVVDYYLDILVFNLEDLGYPPIFRDIPLYYSYFDKMLFFIYNSMKITLNFLYKPVLFLLLYLYTSNIIISIFYIFVLNFLIYFFSGIIILTINIYRYKYNNNNYKNLYNFAALFIFGYEILFDYLIFRDSESVAYKKKIFFTKFNDITLFSPITLSYLFSYLESLETFDSHFK